MRLNYYATCAALAHRWRVHIYANVTNETGFFLISGNNDKCQFFMHTHWGFLIDSQKKDQIENQLLIIESYTKNLKLTWENNKGRCWWRYLITTCISSRYKVSLGVLCARQQNQHGRKECAKCVPAPAPTACIEKICGGHTQLVLQGPLSLRVLLLELLSSKRLAPNRGSIQSY